MTKSPQNTCARTISSAQKNGQGQRGVALLMTLLIVALVGSVVADFQYESRIDYQLAVNARDELQAEYNALSALKVKALLLKQTQKLQSALNSLPGLGQLFGGGDASGGGGGLPIASILESIPIECGLLSMITQVKGGDLEDLQAFAEGQPDSAQIAEDDGQFFPGECYASASSEHGKIGINMLRNGIQGRASKVAAMLMGILNSPAMERHFQEEDAHGNFADSPEELVGAITDWVDADTNMAVSQVADEDRPYAYLKDSYLPKNAPFDSLEELRLVHGVDDELYNLLAKQLTIYNSNTEIELQSASDEMILIGLCASLYDGVLCDDRLAPALQQFFLGVIELRQVGALNVDGLKLLVEQYGLGPAIDPNKLSQTFKNTSTSMWYTLESEGQVGNAKTRITAVFQALEGQFYYYRKE